MSGRSLRSRSLCPDRPETLRRWRRRFSIAKDSSTFALLRFVGEDVAGAAQFVRPERLEVALSRSGDLRPVDNSEIGDMLRRAMADLPVSSEAVPDGKFSRAGVQAKIALQKDGSVWSSPHGASPSTHILKPANPGMEDQDLVEAVTMGTARRLGLSAAHVDVSEFDGLRCLVVERYDRARLPDGRWVRVHQEDMCQATGTPPFRKYESQRGQGAGEVAELIANVSSNADEDTRRFVQALIFNWLICGTDAHARNYSVVLHGGNVRLAPLYDANSHLAYTDGGSSDLSMGIDDIFRASLLTRRRWVDEAMHLHVDPDWMVAEIDRQMARLIDSMHAAADADSVSRYGSSVVTRLLETTERWVGRLE